MCSDISDSWSFDRPLLLFTPYSKYLQSMGALYVQIGLGYIGMVLNLKMMNFGSRLSTCQFKYLQLAGRFSLGYIIG
ncbi:hypothetical protein PRUPE_7G041700 [Prunus persica]|uniref:Uncharacterized protein n=1 Tax=Prunus persica TaxID=3760 RepID=A0A251N6H3_PRUPE|nr:hypothetical protein PRUPE_7G041700 [Prunus persica]